VDTALSTHEYKLHTPVRYRNQGWCKQADSDLRAQGCRRGIVGT